MWFSTIVVGLISLLVIWVSHWVYRWLNPKCTNGKLPPGSMGFPILGETIQFMSASHGLSIPPFSQKRMARYGSIFKTSLFGQKIVVIADYKASHLVLKKEEDYFGLLYADSLFPFLEQKNLLLSQVGSVHKYVKNFFAQLIGPENLQRKFIKDMNESIQRHVHSWADRGVFDVTVASSDMMFEYIANKLLSYDESKHSMKMKENYNKFFSGLLSVPLNIPGTTHHACLKGRDKVREAIRERIEKRKSVKGDLLEYVLEEVKKEDTIMSEELARDFCFVIIFSSFESTTSAITIAMKLISRHPKVLAQLTKEHEEIVKNRIDGGDREMTWQEYKSMQFTQMVINEVLRLGNIVPGIFRKVLKDVEIKGYTIPANWLIMVNSAALHFDPEKYEDPHAFNPWRWEGKVLGRGSKTFMPFGLGGRLCVGADFAKLQIAMYLHHLVLNYRWEVVKGGEIIRKPLLAFPNGLHIKVTRTQRTIDN